MKRSIISETQEATPTELGPQVHFMVLMISEILRAVNIKLVFAVAYLKSITKTKANTKTIYFLVTKTKTINNLKFHQN